MKRIILFKASVLLSLLLLCACGKQIIEVESVTISQTNAKLEIGETLLLKATVSPSEAHYDGMLWSSTSPQVATVSSAGLVTAISEGSSTITVTAGGKKAYCSVIVEKGYIPVSSITFNKEFVELIEGESETLTVTILPVDATQKTITWTSSDNTIANVQDGIVTAVSEGEAIVSARVDEKSALCKVIVSKKYVPVESIQLDKSDLSIINGESIAVKAKVLPENATDNIITWSSDNSDIASVDSDGIITSVSTGETLIRAVIGTIESTCKVVVLPNEDEVFVNFPDDNFKTYCLNHFDVNRDGEISIREAKLVNSISIKWSSIRSLIGIEEFTNLTQLTCSHNGLSSLDISQNLLLISLDCGNNQLKELDISRNTALVNLDCNSNLLTSLDISNNSSLSNLVCYSNQLKQLSVRANPQIINLNCANNALTNIDISNNISLESLDCSSNQLTSLDVSHNTKLKKLSCEWNLLTSLDITSNTLLTTLGCYNNQLTSLDVIQNGLLNELSCNNNLLKILDVSNNPLLFILECDNNQLTSLDVSKNNLLSRLSCIHNPMLKEIWLKKGQMIASLNYDSDTVTIKYVD